VLNGVISVKHFLCGKFSEALDGISAMFNAQVQVRCEIQQSRHWLDVAVLTLGSELHSDDRATRERCFKWHQVAHNRLIVAHL